MGLSVKSLCATEMQDVIEAYNRAKTYNLTVFVALLQEALSGPDDPERKHPRIDKLLIETLENEGYDCSLLKNAKLWYA